MSSSAKWGKLLPWRACGGRLNQTRTGSCVQAQNRHSRATAVTFNLSWRPKTQAKPANSSCFPDTASEHSQEFSFAIMSLGGRLYLGKASRGTEIWSCWCESIDKGARLPVMDGAGATSGWSDQFRIWSEPMAQSLGKSLLWKLRSTEDDWEQFMEGEKSTENQLKWQERMNYAQESDEQTSDGEENPQRWDAYGWPVLWVMSEVASLSSWGLSSGPCGSGPWPQQLAVCRIPAEDQLWRIHCEMMPWTVEVTSLVTWEASC